ncbi:hypothetical protein BaRGS_00005287 [Batillaria attramentaria]|uniref:Uncharacterized protein n=1 Tax=Batillaria attramentaria TaxID=370345 RepID=A0ABD0LUZ4_9CAEN
MPCYVLSYHFVSSHVSLPGQAATLQKHDTRHTGRDSHATLVTATTPQLLSLESTLPAYISTGHLDCGDVISALKRDYTSVQLSFLFTTLSSPVLYTLNAQEISGRC